ncbi:MAG: metallophosphoesterase [Prevotella sp.]|nr:metallophosphoesterase [Prevotella sp.]
MKIMGMLLFMALPLAGITYISWHVWTLLPLSNGWKWLIIIVGILAFLTLFINFSGKLDSMPLSLARTLYMTGTSALFVLLYLTMIFLLLDLGRLLHLVPKAWLHHNAVTSVAILGFIVTIFICANIHYNNKVRVPINLMTHKPLPHDYRIVMASDLHLGYHNTRADLAHWVDIINAEHPDLILLAGDIVDISVRPLLEEHMAEEFLRLQAPVYACLGNHEYYSNEPRAEQFYRDAKINLLRDTSVVVDSALVIIGRDDRTNHRRKSVSQLMEEAARQMPRLHDESYTILLDHQPYQLERTEQAGIDFQLSGHTHRGQIWPVSWITDALYECSWGTHQRGHTQYYVSSGIGIWGGKFRIGTQSEYIVATLATDD